MPGLCSQVLRNSTCQRHTNQPLTVWAIRKTDGSAGHSFSPCPTIWSSNIASSDPSHSRPLALWNLLLFSHYSPTSTPRDPHKENRWLGTSINPSFSCFISRPSPPHLFLILRFFFFFHSRPGQLQRTSIFLLPNLPHTPILRGHTAWGWGMGIICLL